MSFISDVIRAIGSDLTEINGYTVINFGGKAVYVEGFIRLTVLTPERMEFLHKKCVISVRGEGLILTRIDDGSALIEGKIGGVGFEK